MRLLLFAAAAAFGCSNAQADPSAEDFVDVFQSGTEGYACYRIPVLMRLVRPSRRTPLACRLSQSTGTASPRPAATLSSRAVARHCPGCKRCATCYVKTTH